MEKLHKWLLRQGFSLSLVPKADDEVCFDRKVVTINSRCARPCQVSALLHECGHVAVWNCRWRTPQVRVCGSDLKTSRRLLSTDPKRLNKADRLRIVAEEMEAWNRGEKLGRRLKIRFSKVRFERERTKALMTYQRWCVS